MRAGRNIWKCNGKSGCGHGFKSQIHPSECPECGWYEIQPKVNMNRVHGNTYEYYRGDTEWEAAANEVLKSAANYNFRCGK